MEHFDKSLNKVAIGRDNSRIDTSLMKCLRNFKRLLLPISLIGIANRFTCRIDPALYLGGGSLREDGKVLRDGEL